MRMPAAGRLDMTRAVVPMIAVVAMMPMAIRFAAGQDGAENHRNRRQFQSVHVMLLQMSRPATLTP